jgi:RHS repeat-associated protein
MGPSASKERDTEIGLDYFGARYFSGAQGRFTIPDPKEFPHDITDPQSWNKYGYVRNNPLRLVDPDGEDWKDVVTGAMNAFSSDNMAGAGRGAGGNSDYKTGQAIGDAAATFTGTVEALAGVGGEAGGTLLDLTGIGALVGVPTQVVSAGALVHGGATAAVAGGHLVGTALDPHSEAPMERRQNDFTPATKNKIDSNNAAQNSGANRCADCGKQVEKVQSQKGVPTPDNQLQRHHKNPAAGGGEGVRSVDNGEVLCPDCHKKKHNQN